MEILKVIRHTDGGERYLKNAIEYVHKEGLEIKGYGVNPYSADTAFNQMKTVTDYYGKTGYNPLIHFVVSYDNNVSELATAAAMTDSIVSELADNYQMITGIHNDHDKDRTSNFHAHIVMNAVNYNNGKLYHSSKENVNVLAKRVSDVTGQRCIFKFE